MKRTNAMIVCALMVFLSVCGCQSVFNPYDDTFQCPDVSEGKCTSIPNAYQESLTGEAWPDEACSGSDECIDENPQGFWESESSENSRALYQKKKFEILNDLIDSDEPPIVVPPEVVRVLVLSYTGDENEMFGYRYIYFFATDPSWLLSTAVETEEVDGL